MVKKIILLFGPPGSGKGTQGQIITEKLGCHYIAIGTILAELAEGDDSEAREIRNYQLSGQLVPDEIVNKVILNRLKRADDTVVLDGYPRTLLQADFLETNLPQADILAFYLDISDQEVINRITSRRICSKCQKIFLPPDSLKLTNCDHCQGKLIIRHDDNTETAAKRLKSFHEQTEPLVKHFQSRQNLIKINGEQPIESVTKDILKRV